MKFFKFIYFPAILILVFSSIFFSQSCRRDKAYKPNIYIYPTEKIDLSLSISFPNGGKITESIPEHYNGWNFTVEPSGLINSKLNYLFYESTQPDVWQIEYGWIVRKKDLKSFIEQNMARYGFVQNEIKDFTDYWIPKLNEYEYYAIFPQTADIINTVITLNFSKQPDNILRLFYVVKGYNNLPDKLPKEPSEIKKFERIGYYATEWGVVLK